MEGAAKSRGLQVRTDACTTSSQEPGERRNLEAQRQRSRSVDLSPGSTADGSAALTLSNETSTLLPRSRRDAERGADVDRPARSGAHHRRDGPAGWLTATCAG